LSPGPRHGLNPLTHGHIQQGLTLGRFGLALSTRGAGLIPSVQKWGFFAFTPKCVWLYLEMTRTISKHLLE
jgi:hypothetical protein